MSCKHYYSKDWFWQWVMAGYNPHWGRNVENASYFLGRVGGLWLAKWCKIHIHIQCCYWCSRIYLFTFTGVFLIYDYICSHLRDVFIHIQCVAFIHIHDRNIHSAFSAHHFCASLGPRCNMADGG